MLDVLKFVQGAVAKKDYVPALTHFHIKGGRILGHNGRIAISSPIALNLDACPRALDLVRAIGTCKQEVAMHITDTGRLAIKSGKFKAFIECTTDPFPEVRPTGKLLELRPDLLDALRMLQDFTAKDATRQWAMGILFRGPSAYATNNVVVMEYWLGYDFPCEIVIPSTTVAELLRIGEAPTHIQVEHNSATFHYAGDRWLHSLLWDTTWPDVARVLDRQCEPHDIPEGLFDALRDIKPFVDAMSRVYIQPGFLGTHPQAGQGVEVESDSFDFYGLYNIDQLLLLDGIATSIDLKQYPLPSLFYGPNLRGAISGLRA